jgi:hypothetical protein
MLKNVVEKRLIKNNKKNLTHVNLPNIWSGSWN